MVTDDLDERRSLEFSHYVEVLRRRWYVVLTGLVLGVLAGLGYLAVTPKTVTATSTVNLNVISSAPFDNTRPASQLLDPQTEIQVATSSQVLGSAADGIGNGMSLSQMRAHTSVQPVAGATVVKISYSAPTRVEAVAGADAIANEYLTYRTSAAADKVNKVVNKLSDQRDSLKSGLRDANRRIAEAGLDTTSSKAVQAESDRQLINIELTSLVAQINALDSVDTSGGTLIGTAAQSTIKYTPSAKLVLGAGALLGLFLGVILAFVVNRLDRRVADGKALTANGGGAILSELPARHARVPATGADLDEIRSLRERLFATLPAGGTLVVIDLVIRDRPSDVAVDLALSMVEGRDRVRLVLPDHTDEQIAVLATALGLEPVAWASDLTTYTSRHAAGLQVVVTREDHELGAPGGRLGPLLADDEGPRWTTVVAMPPRAPRSLCLTAARLGHSIILVAARRETRVSAVRGLTGELAAVGAVVHGSVLVPRKRSVEFVPTTATSGPPPPPPDREEPAPYHAADPEPAPDDLAAAGSTSAADAQARHLADDTTGEAEPEPDVAEPEVAEVAQREVAQPEVDEPDLAQPEVAQPEVHEPDLAQPEVAQPEVDDGEADDGEADEDAAGHGEVTDQSDVAGEATEVDAADKNGEVGEVGLFDEVGGVSQAGQVKPVGRPLKRAPKKTSSGRPWTKASSPRR